MSASYDKTICANALFAKGIGDDCAEGIISQNTGKIAWQLPAAKGDKSRCHWASSLSNHVRKFTFYIGWWIGRYYPDVIQGALAKAEDGGITFQSDLSSHLYVQT
jgi:hypothetical protein